MQARCNDGGANDKHLVERCDDERPTPVARLMVCGTIAHVATMCVDHAFHPKTMSGQDVLLLTSSNSGRLSGASTPPPGASYPRKAPVLELAASEFHARLAASQTCHRCHKHRFRRLGLLGPAREEVRSALRSTRTLRGQCLQTCTRRSSCTQTHSQRGTSRDRRRKSRPMLRRRRTCPAT